MSNGILERYKRLLIMVGLFLVSSSMFIYEVLTTRLFSTVLVYHFVFLVTSLAILGTGIGGIIVFLFGERLRIFKDRTKAISLFTLILALSYIVITLIIYKLPYINPYFIYSIMASVPFVFGGIVLSLIFKEFQVIGHKLYFADLLGSSIGSLGILVLMDGLGFIGTLLVVSIMALVASLVFAVKIKQRSIKIIPIALIIVLTILSFNRSFVISFQKDFTAYITSPHTVISYWHDTMKRDVDIEYTRWDSISRTDVIDIGDPNRKTIITDGGASAPMVQFDGNLDKVDYLKENIEYISFQVGENDSTLLIGSGGGEDVLLALLGESNQIDAVEINPSTIDAVKEFNTFNGGIYNLDEVSLFVEDGRKFISTTNKKYNHIYLGKVFSGVVDNSAAMLSENYIYTEEAYNEYLNHLSDNGRLTFVFNDMKELFKSLNTMTKVLVDRGIDKGEIADHFIAINSLSKENSQQLNGEIYMPVVIYKETPFTEEESQLALKEIEKQNREIINLPYIEKREEIKLYEYYGNGQIEYDRLVDAFAFNAEPTTDNKPFFYDYDKGISNTLLFLLLGILAFGLIIIATVFNNKNLRKISFYFSIIGLGFMLVEIPFIQKTILFMGSTTRAFSFILFALLFGGGIGSYVSGSRIIERLNKKKDYIFLIIGGFNLVLAFVAPVVFNSFVGSDIVLKFFIVFAMIFPLGVFLGMPFPRGIKTISQDITPNGVPLAWGINGVMSVVSSILSLIISMKLGFNITLILGTMFYLLLFIKNPLRA
ncbi:MAG: hypothetical protein FH761_08030 [Firmicutes bacterium]|nr:hypothetical protein [Bacillota bacterium]